MTVRKKNLGIIIPNLRRGGAERVAANLINNFPESEYNKFLILYDGRNPDYKFNGKLIDMKSYHTKNPLIKIYRFFERYIKLKKIKNTYNIKYSISILNNANLMNVLARCNDKVIVSIHTYKSKMLIGFYGMIYKFLIKTFYKRADEIVVVSRDIKTDLVNNFLINEKKVRVIYNFIETDKIKKMASEEIEDKYRDIFNNRVLINVGRPTFQKGHWHLIRTFSELAQKYNDLHLVIVGDGDLNSYLEKLILQYDLADKIHLLGFQSNPFKYVHKSKIFVFSSIFEGFGLVLTEAMACGIPVISTNCKSGPSEILSDEEIIESNKAVQSKYGILTPVFNGKFYNNNEPLTYEEIVFRDNVEELLNDPINYKHYKAMSLQRAEYFSTDKIIADWLEITN